MNHETAIILLAVGNIAFGAGLVFTQIQFIRQRKHQAEANRAFHRINELQLDINRQQTKLNGKNSQAIQAITENLGKVVEIVTER